jgi:hypothetical protein
LAFCPTRAYCSITSALQTASGNKELEKGHLVGCEMDHDGLAFIANTTATNCDQKIAYK